MIDFKLWPIVFLQSAFVLCLALFNATVFASTEAVQNLEQATIDESIEAFGKALDSGFISVDDFESDVKLYDVACKVTGERYSDYLDMLLEYGVNPSARHPDGYRGSYSLLVCAHAQRNITSFVKLLDEGANSNIYLCEQCAHIGRRPLVQAILGEPEMFLAVTNRRQLTSDELWHASIAVSRRYYHDTWQGQPLNEWYADYLRERGYDIEPKGPRNP